MAAILTPPIHSARKPRGIHWRSPYKDAMPLVPNAATAFICLSILTAFPKKTPTAEQLMGKFDMSRATAYRWRAAIKAVRGEP